MRAGTKVHLQDQKLARRRPNEGKERTARGKGNPNELGGGRAVPEDDGVVDYLPGDKLSSGTSVGGFRSEPRHRGPAVGSFRWEIQACCKEGLNAAAFCR